MRICSLMFLAVLGLAGCASVPKGDLAQEAALKNFIPKPGAASLYVYRKDSVPGFATMEVHVNGHSIGRIADKTFLYVELPPGRHVVTGQSGDTRISGVEIDMRPGKLYYVKQTSQFGGLRASGSVLVRVDDIEAQHAIRKTSLAVGPP